MQTRQQTAQEEARQSMRNTLETMLGGPVVGTRFAAATCTDSKPYDGWLQESYAFQTLTGEIIQGQFLRPTQITPCVPAVLYCHAHGNHYGIGCEELLEGRPSLVSPYGPALKDQGIASLCLDMPCFGARQEPGEQGRAKAHLWQGSTLFGQMLSELSAAVSFLADHSAIDAQKIGATGFSMGSTHAWWLAALDQRIKAAASLCSFADLKTLIETGDHNGHGLYMVVPGLTERYNTASIAALAAPRALLIAVGLQDWSTPENCFTPARTHLEALYAKADASNQLHFHVEPDIGHQETPAMRQAVMRFLEMHL